MTERAANHPIISRRLFMKYTKTLLLSLVLFLIVFQSPISCYSQAGIVGKSAAKKATNSAIKGAIKQETKSATKQAVKKEAVKSSSTIAKMEAKSLTKKAIIQETQKVLESGTVRTSKEAMEAVLKKEARKKASESLVTTSIKRTEKTTLKSGEKTLAKKGVKSTVQKAATKTITKASVQESKTIMNSAVKTEVKALSKIEGVRAAQKVLTKDITRKTASETVEKALNRTSAERWSILTKGDTRSTAILLKDLESNPQLVKSFKQNPALLDAYHRNIGSPKYRTDLNMLRYQSYGANKFSDELVFRNKATKQLEKYTGDNLKIVEKNGINYIKDVKSDKVLGIISGTADNRVIHIKNGDKTLYNLYPLCNTTYVEDNGYSIITRKTDKQGFVKECTQQYYKNIPSGVDRRRNNGKIGTIREIKNDYNSLGIKSSRNHNLDDDGGHIVPKAMGGSDDAINIFPQNSKMNRSGVWKKSETDALKARKRGKYVERIITFSKDNQTSLRPSSAHIIQKIDGKVTVDEIIANPKVNKNIHNNTTIKLKSYSGKVSTKKKH